MKNVKFFSPFVGMLVFCFVCAKAQNLDPVWNAYNANKYEDAIKEAGKVITNFENQAVQMQQQLAKAGCLCPIGTPTAQQRKECDKHWAVNDVATAYWIKAKSAAALGKKKMAAVALKKTCDFSCGRCWDPKGSFWSPCLAQ